MLQLRGLAILLSLASLASVASVRAGEASEAPNPKPTCTCELRSWIVAGHGRHLFAKIDCPGTDKRLSTVVEFTSAALRRDFTRPEDLSKNPPHIAKMNRGVRVRPSFAIPDDRLEATYRITPDIAARLQRDRMFKAVYVLIGRNSNSGMRAALKDAGLEPPPNVLAGGGLLGEFPGIDLSPGAEIPSEQWKDFSLPKGPEPTPER